MAGSLTTLYCCKTPEFTRDATFISARQHYNAILARYILSPVRPPVCLYVRLSHSQSKTVEVGIMQLSPQSIAP